MKKFIFTLVFILFNALIALGTFELYIRLRGGEELGFRARELQYRSGDFTFDHCFIPGAHATSKTKEWDVEYDISAFGFRDREFSKEKPVGAFRILALGDSYVEGYGVKAGESFIKLFEKKINEKGAQRYEVIDGGIASYSPLLEYLLLSKKALELKPDLVMLIYDVGDLKDDYEYEKTTTFDAQGHPVSCAPFDRAWISNETPFQRFLIRHFRAYLYLDNKLNKHFFKKKNRGKFTSGYADEVPHDSFIAYRPGQEKNVAILWERNKKYLGMIADLLKERGVRLVIVSYPYGFQMDPEEWTTGRLNQGFKPHTIYDQPSVLPYVRAFCDEKGVPFLNLYEPFKARYTFPVQYDFDGHLNPSGHRIMADALYEAMLKELAK